MSAQAHSVPGQTKERSKAILEWTRIDLSSKISPTCAMGNVNYYKSAHHPIPTRPVELGNTLVIF